MDRHPKNLPDLCLDFDGVIHRYSAGWQEGEIYDDPVPGFCEWAEEARLYFTLVVYSSRSSTDLGIHNMRLWMRRHGINDGWFVFTDKKPPAFLTIDDRAIQFNGNWRSLQFAPSVLRSFRPWMARVPA